MSLCFFFLSCRLCYIVCLSVPHSQRQKRQNFVAVFIIIVFVATRLPKKKKTCASIHDHQQLTPSAPKNWVSYIPPPKNTLFVQAKLFFFCCCCCCCPPRIEIFCWCCFNLIFIYLQPLFIHISTFTTHCHNYSHWKIWQHFTSTNQPIN